MKNNSLTNYQPKKYTTALEALKAPEPSIAKIKRDRSDVELRVNIAALLERLFLARFSKQQLNQVLCDEFTNWLLTDYYFLKLPEIELALMNYRGETFHVIDLEALKTMIETFDMERCRAVEKLKPEPETTPTAIPMPNETKKLWENMLIKRALSENTFSRRPESLIELFTIQKKKDPEAMAKLYYEEWETQYRTRAAIAKQQKIEIETLAQFLKNRESYFIYNSKVRIYDNEPQ